MATSFELSDADGPRDTNPLSLHPPSLWKFAKVTMRWLSTSTSSTWETRFGIVAESTVAERHISRKRTSRRSSQAYNINLVHAVRIMRGRTQRPFRTQRSCSENWSLPVLWEELKSRRKDGAMAVPMRATSSCMCENVAFRWLVEVAAAMRYREKLRSTRDDKSSGNSPQPTGM
ncbi:hypothetical protein V1477_011321 [Vespula maculifrons]|uniref:Uncharacterized protein n=1 Tax=Vespula maculifrons TaxID=7453 RepID=A0ABD2C4H0_VESMC